MGGNSILRSIVQLVFKILWKLCTVEGQPFPSFKHKFYSLWPQSSSKLWPRENWSAKFTKCIETSSEQSQFHGQYRVHKGTVWHNELSFMKPCDWIHQMVIFKIAYKKKIIGLSKKNQWSLASILTISLGILNLSDIKWDVGPVNLGSSEIYLPWLKKYISKGTVVVHGLKIN